MARSSSASCGQPMTSSASHCGSMAACARTSAVNTKSRKGTALASRAGSLASRSACSIAQSLPSPRSRSSSSSLPWLKSEAPLRL